MSGFDSHSYRRTRYTVVMRERILKLREQGYSYNQIVAELGCAKSTVSYYCGQDQATKTLNRQRDRRNKIVSYIQEVKSKATCMDCGESYPYYVFDFDHRPGELKSFNIAIEAKHHTLEIVKAEIAKCDIVCSNCHRVRTWERLLKTGDSIPEELLL